MGIVYIYTFNEILSNFIFINYIDVVTDVINIIKAKYIELTNDELNIHGYNNMAEDIIDTIGYKDTFVSFKMPSCVYNGVINVDAKAMHNVEFSRRMQDNRRISNMLDDNEYYLGLRDNYINYELKNVDMHHLCDILDLWQLCLNCARIGAFIKRINYSDYCVCIK